LFGATPLHYAADKNSKECMELLLAHGTDVNVKDNVSKSDNNDIISYNIYIIVLLYLVGMDTSSCGCL